MLDEVVDLLACPHCGAELDVSDRTLLCGQGHSFDVAKQGYVSLLSGASKITGDSAEMIAARVRFLDGGHFDPLMEAVARACVAESPDRSAVLEVGAGTGHYLAAVLDALPGARGIGVDVSKAAARRLARSHPRAASVVADIWTQLPVREHATSHVLSIFAPRNAAELRRVLRPDGTLVVLTPTDRHLRELVDLLGLVRVDENKTARLGAAMAGHFERIDRVGVEYPMSLSHSDVDSLVAMGPSARHLGEQARASRIAELTETSTVTASVTISRYRPLYPATAAS
ncbi:methyltransferase domain-containing protein [Rhodococcus spelaei]|uniref:Methyltransferase domain-containing protein n=1 Tax=Rhodococcus spelaei TaxID=2546320 RepID=A0A541AZZ9_9NOCA|nr:methyltransferase domain-containing protein [Rhodococcus spelaei]TQF65624.1 methyltransferase domain-containing protein [Rhodococcus spelaei]